MSSGIRPMIEQALAATAERLSPGSGPDAVKHAKNDLSMIGATKEDFNARYANDAVLIAAPAVFEAKKTEGDPVSFGKRHEGVLVVFADSLLYVRQLGFGAREVKALKLSDMSVERVSAVVDGRPVAGLRVAARLGKPKFVAAVEVSNTTVSSSEQVAVRDEIYNALAQ